MTVMLFQLVKVVIMAGKSERPTLALSAQQSVKLPELSASRFAPPREVWHFHKSLDTSSKGGSTRSVD